MEWLKKYWIVPVIIVVVIAVYLYLTKDSRNTGTGVDDTARLANLEDNDQAFINWGLNVTFNPQYNGVLIKAQGNGNATEFVWTVQRDMQFHSVGQTVSEVQNNYDSYSSDGDFYINIRSVLMKNQNGVTNAYCVISLWDPSDGAPDVMQPSLSKAAVLVNWIEKTLTVVKAAPASGGKL